MELSEITLQLNKIKGHSRITEPLARAVAQNRFPHALLFAGPDGVGKMLTARSLAALLLAQTTAPEKRAVLLERLAHGTYQDLVVVDAAWGVKNPSATIKIEAVRNLEERVRIGPYESDRLVVIIEPADEMTAGAANALLKTLEEPPPGIYFFLIAQSPDRLLQTIRSRCHTFRFSPLPPDALREVLTERSPGLDQERLTKAIALADGSVGKALDNLNSEDFQQLTNLVDTFLTVSLGGSLLDILKLAETLGSFEKELYARFFPMVEQRLVQISTSGSHCGVPLRNFDIKGWIETLDEGKRDLGRNVNRRLLSEHLLWTLRKL